MSILEKEQRESILKELTNQDISSERLFALQHQACYLLCDGISTRIEKAVQGTIISEKDAYDLLIVVKTFRSMFDSMAYVINAHNDSAIHRNAINSFMGICMIISIVLRYPNHAIGLAKVISMYETKCINKVL